MAEPFKDRLNRLLEAKDVTPEDAASAMRVKVYKVNRLLDGTTSHMWLEDALRLCERYGIDPWQLAFGRPRSPRGEDAAADRGCDAHTDSETEPRLPTELMVALAQMREAIGANRKLVDKATKVAERAEKTAAEAKRLAARKAS